MPEIRAEFEFKSLREFVNSIQNEVLRAAATKAINSTATKANTQAKKLVRQTFKLPAAEINKAFKVEKAKPTDSEPDAKIVVKGKPIPVFKFKPKDFRVQTTKGPRVGVTVDIVGRRTRVRGGFPALMPNGRVGIFKRDERASGKAGRDAKGILKRNRLPIFEVKTSSIPVRFEAPKTQKKLQKFIQDTFPVEFDKAVTQAKRKAGIE